MTKKLPWTRERIRDLSPEEYAKHRDEIMDALAKGEVKAPPYRTSVRMGDQ